MRKTFLVGKLSRESAEIVLASHGSTLQPFRALRALVVKAGPTRR
jgi:hypothetical protein